MATAVVPVEENIAEQDMAKTRIPVEVYLHTSYRPDCDFLDGELLERNVGEIPHATIQGFFVWYFRNRETEWKYRVLPEQRVQISKTRFRVPDCCVVPLDSDEKRIIRKPPVVCIEVLSPEDRMSEMQERIADYARMGVKAIWVIDPLRRTVVVAGKEGEYKPAGAMLTVEGTPIAVPVADVFAELDRYGL